MDYHPTHPPAHPTHPPTHLPTHPPTHPPLPVINKAEVESALDEVNTAASHMGYHPTRGQKEEEEEEEEEEEVFPQALAESITNVLFELNDGYGGWVGGWVVELCAFLYIHSFSCIPTHP